MPPSLPQVSARPVVDCGVDIHGALGGMFLRAGWPARDDGRAWHWQPGRLTRDPVALFGGVRELAILAGPSAAGSPACAATELRQRLPAWCD